MNPNPLVRATIISTVIPIAAACTAPSQEGDRRQAAGQCAEPASAEVGVAVAEYIKIAKPRPVRFLVAVGTDSALPDPGVLALQDRGPTYFYPADTAQRRRVRGRLAEVGDYPTMLVALRSVSRVDSGRAMVRLGGQYVGGTHDGLLGVQGALHFRCEGTRWRFTHSSEERMS